MNTFVIIWAWTLPILGIVGVGCYFLLKYIENTDDMLFDCMWEEVESGNLEFNDLLYWVNL